MNALDLHLQAAVAATCASTFGDGPATADVQITRTRKEFRGDRTVVVFPLTRYARLSPEATATTLGEALVAADPRIVGFEVVKGFLNLEVDRRFWGEALEQAVQNPHFGLEPAGSKPLVMVEYSSPNTNKPLHLGHLRNNFLGYSVARLLEAVGHTVVKVQIINDRGIHICKSMWAWRMHGAGETPSTSGMKGDKLVGKYYVLFDTLLKAQTAEGIAAGFSPEMAAEQAPAMVGARELLQQWEAGDPEVMDLWRTMNGWVYAGFEETYREMGVDFDKLYYESDTYLLGKDEVLRGCEAGVFERRPDGSVWVDLREEGLDEKLLLRKDGTAVYMTQDIGTAILRFREYPGLDRQIYTVGNEQEYHFKVLFAVLARLGFEQAKRCAHLSYGMVELPDGKMKSREGTVVDADDLMAEMIATARQMAEELGKTDGMTEAERDLLHRQVGLGALKYYLLKVSPAKSMLFDPAASIDFIGHTGPFIQFNRVRAVSVLRNAGGVPDGLPLDAARRWDDEESDLVQTALGLPEAIAAAAATHDPSTLAQFAYDTAKAFSRWYQDHPVLNETDPELRALRLAICALVDRALDRSMSLLGIDMPERM